MESPICNDVTLPRAKTYGSMTEKQATEQKLGKDDLKSIVQILGRGPTLAEIAVFSAMWSEHCSYKSSRIHLKRLPSKGECVVVGPGENAGVVRLHKNLCLAFKMESHNHPSFIEPYQGAATGVGGILRDVFCMGSRPIANLNALRFGSQDHQKTPWLLDGVVKGIGDYGNCIGVPTVGGSIGFDSAYNGNILVNAMTIGLVDERAIFKGHASGEGNLVVYLGSATGRDGIHGASMASESFDSDEAEQRSAIQVGDPFCEKLLLEATLEVLDKKLVVGIQDMGAAGLTSSLFEMAERGESGLLIDLDRVPTRAENMSAQELMLSESQERMALVIRKQDWQEVQEVFERWQLAHAVIGEVTKSNRVQATYRGKLELDVPVAPLVDSAPRYDLPRTAPPKNEIAERSFDEIAMAQVATIEPQELIENLCKLMNGKASIYSQYDHQVGGRTKLGPRQTGAAVVWIHELSSYGIEEEDVQHLGVAAAAGCLENYCRVSPKAGAAHSVLKVARSLYAAGAEPLAITDCLNFGNPNNPEVMHDFSESVDGIALACEQLNLPVVSGNVSLYNETDGASIPPTPMIGVVGKVEDVRQTNPGAPTKPTKIFLLSPRSPKALSLAASCLTKLTNLDQNAGRLCGLLWQEERLAAAFIWRISQSRLVNAVRDIGEGGVLGGALKMSFTTDMSLRIDEEFSANLIAERAASYLCCVEPMLSTQFTDEFNSNLELSRHLKLENIGSLETRAENKIDIGSMTLSWEKHKALYQTVCH